MTQKITFTIQEIEQIIVDYAFEKRLITTPEVKLRWWLADGNSTLTIFENKS